LEISRRDWNGKEDKRIAKMTTEFSGRTEARTDNRRLAKKRVQWLIEHSTSYQILCWFDSFVLRNPLLRQAPKRYIHFRRTIEQKDMKVTSNKTYDYRASFDRLYSSPQI
jgi:hypothetical protein